MDNDNPLGIVLDLEVIREKIPGHSSVKLCEMIISTRYLGMDSQICIACMEELAKRRESGDTFDFESYIQEAGKDMPVLDMPTMDFRAILAQIRKT
jgi:hypothetical protein